MRKILNWLADLLPVLRETHNRSLLASGKIFDIMKINLDEADKVIVDYDVKESIVVGLVKEVNPLGLQYTTARDYWPKFERFLVNNCIDYGFVDIHSSNWIENVKQYDVILWHTHSSPLSQSEAESKIYFINKILGIPTVPNYEELWPYESKIRMHCLFVIYGLPEISTFVSYSKEDAVKFINQTNFPIISKIDIGSSSQGVTKIDSRKDAIKLLNSVFSYEGRNTYWPDQRQKGYVLLQEFVPNAKFDLRVIVVGDRLFGYYRFPKKGDFKASGTGIYEKKSIEKEALDIAWEVKRKFGARFLATDMLFDERDQKYKIIESSFFIGIDTCEQLIINGIPGYYQKNGSEYTFKPGRYWVQELLLLEVMKEFK